VKALAIFSADEAGTHDGPDYSNGWGLMNTVRAADAIAGAAGIVETELVNGNVKLFEFTVDTMASVRTTIVWTDPPGPVLAPAIDPGTRVLVNDLDVRLEYVSTGFRYDPWVLNKRDPSAPAQKGDNKVDNVEQIDIAHAQPGKYLIAMSHKGSLRSGRQAFSVVCSESISVYLVSSYRSRYVKNAVEITWMMADSASDYSYLIARKTMPGETYYELRRHVIENGPLRILRDRAVQFEHTYVYRISMLRNQNIEAEFTTTVTTPPYVFTLKQNYPNPFNPTTSIDYILEQSGPVSLKIYDVAGRLVRTLVDRSREKGQYSEVWDGADSSGRGVANGVYFYRLVSGGQTAAMKMLLLK